MRQRSETLRASCTPDSRPMRAFRLLGRFQFLHPLLYPLILTLLSAPLTTPLRADTISGTVKDPSGAVVAGARIEISGVALAEPLVLTSDGAGKFIAPNLSAGKYSVRVSKEAFDDLVTAVDLNGTADLPLSLTITAQQTSVTVNEKSSTFANSDPVYRQLRSVGLGDTFRCENFTVPMDVGTFVLKSGTITFLGMVNKSQTGAIFVGQGHFTLKPLATLDTNEMVRRAGGPTAEEDFTEVVFRFSPDQFSQFAATLGTRADAPAEAASAFQRWKDKVRHRHEVPEGLTEAFLESDTIDNVDADVLAAVYNPKHPPFFNAYMHGTPNKDLRFFLCNRVGHSADGFARRSGARQLQRRGNGRRYLLFPALEIRACGPHRKFATGKRLFATRRYNIETVIGKNNHLFSRATI